MKFKEGDKVQFIREGSMVEGVVKEVKDCSPDMWYLIDDKCKDSWIFGGHLILLTLLPVIPKFAADAINTFKDEGDSLAVAIDYEVYTEALIKELSLDIKMRGWLWETSNQELFARAWLDGYEVEKEPLYYVKLPISKRNEATDELEIINMCLLLNIRSRETCISGNYRWVDKLKRTGWRTKLTEAQIKDMPEGDIYWQFAVLVEEEEE
ncbi:TPA: DUF1642 domain-containing protein [Listeria monocytogenes]|nr:DUF1642 domain-containing protein [Listeria monocytogenes]EDN8099909.1 DUF1642 domain-containing protein [Listeria monocytogenes]HBM3695643.1 DUF1642 domain-containing protein [Listeria monocytogenes]